MINVLRKVWLYLRAILVFMFKVVKYTLLFAFLVVLSVLVMFVAFPICLVLQCIEPLLVLAYWALTKNNYYSNNEPIIIKFFGFITWMNLDEFL